MNLGAYRVLLDAVSSAFRIQIMPLLRMVDWSDADAAKQATPEVARIVREFRGKAAQVATNFLRSEAQRHGREAFIPPVEGYPDQAVAQAAREARSLDELAAALQRHVETAARRQVVRAVPDPEDDSGLETDVLVPETATPVDLADVVDSAVVASEDPGENLAYPIGWARVLTGVENCAFCAMLASRGPVYSSRTHASRKSTKTLIQGHDRLGRKRKRVLKRISDQAYHDHCDCVVVPVYRDQDWPGCENYERLADAWGAMRRDNPHGGLNQWAEWLEKHPVEIPDIRKEAA